MGRPKGSGSKFTTELGAAICSEIATGKPLLQICREMSLARQTIYDWRASHPEFGVQFARARETGEDELADQCLDIANTPQSGVIRTTKPDGSVEERCEDMLGHRKLQIETRLKLLAKWNPAKWGDKVEQTHKGGQTIVIGESLSRV